MISNCDVLLKASIIVGTVVVIVTGCGAAPSSTSSSSASAQPTAQASGNTPSGSAEAATVIDISIDDGLVTPTNAEAQAVAGQPIVLQVSSDAIDSLHVHSVPEHVFDIAATPDQRFEFRVNIPGRVAVELHDLHVTVATIEVRP